eukprot:TRINITY_DN22447_c0_g1_i1.p1 TRINITY_DN22447_c0_g1~~TRINITY_DN22447_c0_g1_i1.p1  ORF type:complete len:486 (-),score=48.84 TRINITY_DN22447_c0_g1_i1:20-1477(-)
MVPNSPCRPNIRDSVRPDLVGRVRAWEEEVPVREGDANCVYSFESDLAMVLFSERQESDPCRAEVRPVAVTLQPFRWFTLKEMATIGLVAGALSLCSFVFAFFYFGILLQGPTDDELMMSDVDFWTDCVPNTTSTALDQHLSLEKVVMLTSIPKFVCTFILVILYGRIFLGTFGRSFAIHSLMQAGLLGAGIFLVCKGIGGKRLDPIISLSQTIVTGVSMFIMASNLHITKQSAFRRAAFYLTFASCFMACIIIINALEWSSRERLNPSIVISVTLTIAKMLEHCARAVYKLVDVPTWVCTTGLFIIQCVIYSCARRYMLNVKGTAEVVVATMLCCFMEIVFNAISIGISVWCYNAAVTNGQHNLAVRTLNIHFTSVISDMVAEQISLHGSLGFVMFVDTRLFTFHCNDDKALIWFSWSIQFLAELVSDSATFILAYGLLPLRCGPAVTIARRCWALPGLICALPFYVHTQALRQHVRVESFTCH